MLSKIILMVAVAAVAVLLMPSPVDAYGACHASYTHVGPNGAYHTSATAVSGPGGAYAGRETTAAGGAGGAYHAGYGGAAVGGTEGYHYDYHYAGGAAVGGEATHYGYVR